VLTRESAVFDISYNNVLFTNNANIHADIYANRAKYCEQFPFISAEFKIYIIGGAQIYRQFIPKCERIWATRIKKDYDCDLFYSLDDSECSSGFSIRNTFYEDNDLSIMEYVRG